MTKSKRLSNFWHYHSSLLHIQYARALYYKVFTAVYEHFIFKRTIQPLTVLRVFTKRTSKVVEPFISSWMWGAPKREVPLLCAPIILYLFHWPEVSPPQTRGDRRIIVTRRL